jgi:hypothetical protein
MTAARSQAAAPPPALPPPLSVRAGAAGLSVRAAGAWPEGPADGEPPQLPGFVVSSFSPLFAAAARRCLERRPEAAPDAVTAVVVVSALGDVASAVHVAAVVDAAGGGGGAQGGGGLSPLMFFQAVPNAVAGHVAAKWGLFGPVVCVADTAAGVEVAALLVEDGDADEVLLVRVDQATAGAGARDRAEAVLVSGGKAP